MSPAKLALLFDHLQICLHFSGIKKTNVVLCLSAHIGLATAPVNKQSMFTCCSHGRLQAFLHRIAALRRKTKGFYKLRLCLG